VGYRLVKTEISQKKRITTTLELKRFPLDKAEKYLAITGMRTVQELNGITAMTIFITMKNFGYK
jgi:hypothetical protein